MEDKYDIIHYITILKFKSDLHGRHLLCSLGSPTSVSLKGKAKA